MDFFWIQRASNEHTGGKMVMTKKKPARKVQIGLDAEQVDQLTELIKRDGSNANVVFRKALANLYAERERLMPVVVAG